MRINIKVILVLLYNIAIIIIQGCNSPTAPKNDNISDTTSHNFTWQYFNFGQVIESYLLDVTIVDENNIWAVGGIYLKDSTGQVDPILYNAVHWDGNKWNVMRLYYNYMGQNLISSINAVYAFNKDDVWFGMGSMIHWNGKNYEPISNAYAFPSTINKIWGSSGNDLYIVGNRGAIAHYDGNSWTRIESGTNLPFQDIWGAYNEKTSKWEILAIASDKFGLGGEYLVQIEGNKAIRPQSNIPPPGSLSGIWFIPDKKYYIVGNGIYGKQTLSDSVWQTDSLINKIKYYPYEVRGNTTNDVVIAAEGGTICHFNGIDWKIFRNLERPIDRYRSVSIKDNLIIAVGEGLSSGFSSPAIIAQGRRRAK